MIMFISAKEPQNLCYLIMYTLTMQQYGKVSFQPNKHLAPGNERGRPACSKSREAGPGAGEGEGRRFSDKKFLVLRETGEN